MNLDTTLNLDRDFKELFVPKKTAITDDLSNKLKSLDEQESLKKNNDLAREKEDKKPQVDVKSIQQSLESINQVVPIINTNLVFEFDDLNDPPIIKVIDRESKELIREIPSRELDKLAQAFSEMADKLNKSGALFNTQI